MEKIEIEITKNAYISLNNIDLNAYEINKKHLKNSPLKMLEGKINKLDLLFSKERIEVKVESISVLLMPVFNAEKFENQIMRNSGIKLKNGEKESHMENSIISNLLNSVLGNVEISVKNIQIKILTYEVFNNSHDNPTLSLYINRVEWKKIDLNNQNEDKPFIFNKKLIFDRICLKIEKNYSKEEDFLNHDKEKSEKFYFNLFCENSSIFTLGYSSLNLDDSSLIVNFTENKNFNGENFLKVDIYSKKIEALITPLQLELLLSFLKICKKIFHKTKKTSTENQMNKNVNELKILHFKLFGIEVNFSLESLCFILQENYFMDNIQTPKLWSFFESNYNKYIRTVDQIESHFSYLEDNFFLFYVENINCNFIQQKKEKNTNVSLTSVHLKYVEFKNKCKGVNKKVGLRFSRISKTSRISFANVTNVNQSVRNNESIYQSTYESVQDNSFHNYVEETVFESAMDSNYFIVDKFNKILEFDYLFQAYNLFTCLTHSKHRKNSFEMKINSLCDGSNDDKMVDYTSINIEDVTVNFHPVFLFKFSKLFYNNVIVFNETMFFDNENSSGKVSENISKIQKKDNLINENENEKLSIIITDYIKENNSNNSNILSSNSKTNENKKIQISVASNEIRIKILNFNNDQSEIQDNVFSSYFIDYYSNNIKSFQNFSEKKDSRLFYFQDKLMENLITKDNLLIKIYSLKFLFHNRILESINKKDTFVDIEELAVIFNETSIFNYKKNDYSNNDKTKYITGLNAPLKEIEVLSKSRKDSTSSIDDEINKNFIKMRYAIFHQKFREFVNNDKTIKEINSNLQEIYKSNSQMFLNIENFEKNIIKVDIRISIHENLNFFFTPKTILHILKFLDELNFTFNIFKIYNRENKKIYKKFEHKKYEIYNIQRRKNTITKLPNELINNLKILKITLPKINLFFLKQNSNSLFVETNVFSKIVLDKLSLSIISTNLQENEFIFTLKDLKLLLVRNSEKINYENLLNNINEELYNVILYKEKSNSDILNIKIKIKEFESDHELLKLEKSSINENVKYVSQTILLDFIKNNLIKMNRIEMKINLILQETVLAIFYKNFDLKNLELIVNEILPKKEIQPKNKLFNLIQERKVDLSIALEIKRFTVDFSLDNKVDVKNSMRLFVTFSDFKITKNNTQTNLHLNKFQVYFLTDLSLLESQNLLMNKLDNLGNENCTIKSLGFVELMNLEKLKMMGETDKSKGLSIELDSIEFNFCKDSFNNFKKFIQVLNDNCLDIVQIFMVEKPLLQEKENIPKDIQKEIHRVSDPNLNLNNENEIILIDNYCQNLEEFQSDNEDEEEKIKINIVDEDDELLGPLGNSNSINNTCKDNYIKIQKSKRKRSSFDMIYHESSIQETYINFKLNNFRFYLFKGKDFDFKSENMESNNNSMIDNNSSISKSNISNLIIIEDYICHKTEKSQIQIKENENLKNNETEIKERKRNKNRDYNNHICLFMQNLKFESSFYKESKISESNKIFSIKLYIKRLDIDDYVKKSRYKKIISKYDYDDESPFMSFEAEMMKNKSENESEIQDSEIFIYIHISSINFLIDQYTLIFLLDFFNVKLNKKMDQSNFSQQIQNNNEIVVNQPFNNSHGSNTFTVLNKNENLMKEFRENNNKLNKDKQKLIFVRKVKINEFFVNFSYSAFYFNFKIKK